MSDIEKKMLDYLQDLVDWVEYDRHHNSPEDGDMARFNEHRLFVERVTGKKVIVKKWKVMFEEA